MAGAGKEPILIISPTELKFKFELRKQIPATLVLHNPAEHTVAFKVKTTTPKKYCVRPSTGFVLPKSKVPVAIMMSSQKEVPADLGTCRDKFLVQSVKLTPEEAGNKVINPDLFSKQGGKDVHEFKLRVAYLTQQAQPSPVKEEADLAPNGSASAGKSGAGAKPVSETTPPAPSPPAAVAGGKEAASAKKAEAAAKPASLPAAVAAASGASSAGARRKASGSSAVFSEGTGAVGLPVKKTEVLQGFSFLHLLLTALLAFVLGKYLA